MQLKYVLAALLISGSVSAKAQESVNSSGGEASSSSGSVSYSVGQAFYQSYITNGETVNEGVQQPFELFTLSLPEGELHIAVSVFPNPSSDYFVLEFPAENKGRYYKLHDVNGRLLMTGELTEAKNWVPAHDLPSSPYILEITEGTTIGTFRLIKN